MTGRHIFALTNSIKAADLIEAATREDFPDSVERNLVRVDGYGLCEEITVDADEFERWVQP